jgi:hypothetical protein
VLGRSGYWLCEVGGLEHWGSVVVLPRQELPEAWAWAMQHQWR